jgi:nucleoporin SEH1
MSGLLNQLFLLSISTANYLQNWKCIAVLKGDGSGVSPEDGTDRDKTVSAATARYFKLGAISNPNQVPWH